MRFLVMSSAYANAGDFLIVQRGKELLKHVFPECHIEEIKARTPLEDHLDYVNTFDWLVFCGGPGYIPDYRERHAPLVSDLKKIKPRLVILGFGWYGEEATSEEVYSYRFSDRTKELFLRAQADSNFLGCRDTYSVRVLKNNMFSRPILTGCPAWYDVTKINSVVLRKGINFPFKKICVSTPANMTLYSGQLLSILEYLKQSYPASEIRMIFHRGMGEHGLPELHQSVVDAAAEMGITSENIVGDSTGFAFYDDCDLHIGYRVHAHIYNLSQRNISVLIEEDGRGAGVNETLGLVRILAYASKNYPSRTKTAAINSVVDLYILGTRVLPRNLRTKLKVVTKLDKNKKTDIKTNENVIREIQDYMYLLETGQYAYIKRAFETMQTLFDVMVNRIKSLDI